MKKQTVAQRIEESASERRAISALRAMCRSQDQLNELLWAMVASMKEAQKAVHEQG